MVINLALSYLMWEVNYSLIRKVLIILSVTSLARLIPFQSQHPMILIGHWWVIPPARQSAPPTAHYVYDCHQKRHSAMTESARSKGAKVRQYVRICSSHYDLPYRRRHRTNKVTVPPSSVEAASTREIHWPGVRSKGSRPVVGAERPGYIMLVKLGININNLDSRNRHVVQWGTHE